MGVGETISLDSQSDLESASEQIGLATYVAAVAFNSASLPPTMPAWMKAAIGEKATALRADPNNPFLMQSILTRETTDKRQNERDAATRTQMILIAQEQERERAEWERTKSTVGGVAMTGAEWGDLAKRMREDEDFHRRLIEVFRERGMSETEAEARYDRVAEAAEIAAIPPGQRTEEQKAIEKRNEADLTFKQDVAAAKALMTPKPDVTARSELNGSFSSAVAGVNSNPDIRPQPAPTAAPTVTVPNAGF